MPNTSRPPQFPKWLLLGGALAAVAGIAAVSRLSRPAASASGQKSAGATSAQIGAPSAIMRREGPLFPRGVELTFDLKEQTRIATSGGQSITELALRGPLRLTGLESESRALVRGEFAGTVTAGAGDGTGLGGVEALSAAAHLPFVLEFSPDGRFVAARGGVQIPAFVARVWISLGEYLQLLRDTEKDQWERHETDAAGTYLASYLQKGPFEIQKRKVMYESMSSDRLSSYDILKSSETFHLDVDGALRSILLAESTSANPGDGPLPAFEGTTELALDRTGDARVTERLAAYAADAAGALPLAERRKEEDAATRNRARIGGINLGDALGRLELFGAKNPTADQKDRAGRAFVALTAMLREDPSVLGVIKERLLQKGPMTTTLLAALRDASTPASQALLAEMASANSPLDPEMRMEAARSLSRVETPSKETVTTLKTLRADPEVGLQATYGLGSALYRLKGTDPLLASDARDTLTTQLSSATTASEQAAALTALGNAGDPSTLDTVRAYLTSESVEVRAAAAQALRRIPGFDADQLLAATCSDPAVDVRFSAVDAIRERQSAPVLATALAALAVRESEFQVRAKAVSTLATWAPQMPAIAEVLRVVAASDQSADLRNIAKVALPGG
ncbi:MAG TPA: HEAT repeat domain-containing protein [Polyangiaceae bacterium]|nr:HEAT repeat domain-containing protein [Polyangiaceae bacterium]